MILFFPCVYGKEESKEIKVQGIEFNGLSSSEQVNFSHYLTLQVGSNFYSDVFESDAKKLEFELQQQGYPNAKVGRFEAKQIDEHFVKLTYQIEKKNPCHIEQVSVQNTQDDFLNFGYVPIEIGSLCNIVEIKDKLEIIREQYIEDGYFKPSVSLKSIVYSEKKESAKVVLQIEKGPKTTVKIVDETKKIEDLNILSDKATDFNYSDILETSDDDLKRMILSFYQKQGYAFVHIIDFKKVQDQQKNIRIDVIIEKGKYLKIGKTHYLGFFPESKSDLDQYLTVKGRFFAFQDPPFFEGNIDDYKERLRNMFIKHGYLDAEITNADFVFPLVENGVDLYFSAQPGERYVVSDIQISGLPENFHLDQNKLQEIFKKNETVNPDKTQEYTEEIRRQLLENGYLYAQVKIDQTIQQDLASVDLRRISWKIQVNAYDKVHIRNVYAQGDLFGKYHAIIAVSGLEKGDLFTQSKLDAARLHVLRHDLFSSVSVEALDPSALNRHDADLDVIIRTKARGGFALSFMPGYGTLKGYRFSADFTLNRLNKDGLRLISNGSVSQELQQQNFATSDTQQILGQQINIGLVESLFKFWTIETPLDVSAIAGYQVVAETLTNRRYQTLKLISEWKPSFFDLFWTYSATLLHETSASTNSESAVVQTIDSPSIKVREFVNSVALDTRNSTGWPTAGGLYSARFGIARFGMGSDVQFNRYQMNADYFFPIYKKLSGAVSLGGSFIENTVNTSGVTVTPPASRRATLTDEALIRGFPETYGSAAPGPLLWIHYANNGVPNCNTQLASIGGTKLIFAKAEARYRVSEAFGLVAFLDSGESYFTPDEVSQTNQQIAQQIASGSPSTTQCVVDNATLVAPGSSTSYTDALSQYWKQAYASTGVGLRVILGNYATINLDYGYPLKDPASHYDNCMSTSQAQQSSTAPQCITRIQDSTILWDALKFKGALHFGIGAKF